MHKKGKNDIIKEKIISKLKGTHFRFIGSNHILSKQNKKRATQKITRNKEKILKVSWQKKSRTKKRIGKF